MVFTWWREPQGRQSAGPYPGARPIAPLGSRLGHRAAAPPSTHHMTSPHPRTDHPSSASTDDETTANPWLPLAFRRQGLPGAMTQRDALAAAIRDSVETTAVDSEAGSPVHTAAWTGDRFGATELHRDRRLTWLRRSLAAQVWTYLADLGRDLDTVDVRIVGCWGVVSEPGEHVPGHAHHDSDLTAVYYVDVPADSGALRFFSTAYGTETLVDPDAGALVIFPSRQRHEVLENRSGANRLSISFELDITPRTGDDTPDELGDTDLDALPRPKRLGERAVRPHTLLPTSRATASRISSAIATTESELRRVGTDPARSRFSIPSLVWRRGDERTRFEAGASDLYAYLRIDDGPETCMVEMEGSRRDQVLEPRKLQFVRGSIPHRIVGGGVLVRFDVQLPADRELPLERDELVALLATEWSRHISNGGEAIAATDSAERALAEVVA